MHTKTISYGFPILMLSLLTACLPFGKTIGGSITGLTGSGIVLQNNGGDNLAVTAGSTQFSFVKTIARGESYAVTVLTQPQNQTCTVSNGSGMVADVNVSNIIISCASNAPSPTLVTVAAGSSITMTVNESVLVPSGTTVSSPSGTIVTINGSSNTINTQVGSVVNVPASATGPANNIVTTGQTSGSGILSTSLTVTSLAGSPTISGNTVDGTGSSAIFWGGGHLAVDSNGNIIVSDRGSLRKVTQAGVVTTLVSGYQPCDWEGIAIDSSGNIYGSGSSSPNWSASVCELTASGTVQTLFSNWETSLSNPSMGWGGLVVDTKGNLFLADGGSNRIIKFTPTGNWMPFAGSGASGNLDGVGTAATISLGGGPGLAIDANDNLFVISAGAIRKIAPDGTVTTVISNIQNWASAIAVDQSENLYFAGFQAIYRLSSSGSITSFTFPNATSITSMTTDKSGNLYAGTRGEGSQIFKISF